MVTGTNLNIIAKIAKYSFRTIIALMSIVFIMYMGLWIYTIQYVSQDFKDYYQNSKILDIDDNQYEIIWFVLSRNNNNGFKWQPFIFDIVFDLMFFDKNEFVPKISMVSWTAAETIIWRHGHRDLNSAHLKYYALYRYITFDNNWKKCLSIIVQYYYYGNDIIGITDASEYFYNKPVKYLSDKELISLLLFHQKFIIGSDELNEKVERIYGKMKNDGAH